VSEATGIPDLERLLRDVLRRCFETAFGPEWLSQLNSGVRPGVLRAGEVARSQRPTDLLRDDWDAAGLGEMDKALRSHWADLKDLLGPVWAEQNEAVVDLSRLRGFRGRELHAVGPRLGAVGRAELDAIVQRLRIGLEGVRRAMANDQGDWWPYIEAIHSNVPEFNGDRENRPGRAKLIEGDTVTFEVVGVHPTKAQQDLIYKLELAGPGASSGDGVDWQPGNQFQVQVPRARTVAYHLFVADANDKINNDEWVCGCEVRPQAS
jgi:hypothetical protein